VALPLGTVGFVVIGYLMVVGFSNAVNLTAGLDGLAIMPTVMIASALAVFAYVSGNVVFARYLAFPYIAGVGELAIICGAIAGADPPFFSRKPYFPAVFQGHGAAVAQGVGV